LTEKIVAYCKEICLKKGLKALRLDTDAARRPLINLYEKLGFKLCAVKEFEETKCCDVTKIALFEMEI
jgi:ribosomal protein S18 acetylase RimI-like enzyme